MSRLDAHFSNADVRVYIIMRFNKKLYLNDDIKQKKKISEIRSLKRRSDK